MLIAVARSSTRIIERAVRGVDGVGGEPQAGVAARAADELGQRRDQRDELDDLVGGGLGDPAAERHDLGGDGVGFVEERVDAGVARGRQQGLEVPGDVGMR